MKTPACIRRGSAFISLLCLVASGPALAGPWINPGERTLRADIQLLVDAGVIETPIMTWPIPTAELSRAVQFDPGGIELTAAEEAALARLRARIRRESNVGDVDVSFRIGAAETPTRLRTFTDTPREDGEIGISGEWIGQKLAVGISLTAVLDPVDDKEVRIDGSHLDAVFGNWIFSANALERWWGPGWDGSIILGTNARPIPALTLERNYADAPDIKWLRWVGPWRASMIWGFLEEGRDVPDARFFGLRFEIRPLPHLNFGVSRTAQWCGQGRPCDFDTFVKLLIGDDNSGGEDDTLSVANEPGNQMAGFDLRWSADAWDIPVAVYAQAIGEDEAGGFPSRYLGMLGLEATLQRPGRANYWHAYLELADTACDFVKSKPRFNCGYNNSIFTDGYRYRDRSIGHAFDNDARGVSLGVDLVDADGSNWGLLLRAIELNRAGPPDSRNTITPTAKDLLNIEFFHSRQAGPVFFEAGVGVDLLDDKVTGGSAEDVRLYFRMTSGPGA